MNMYTYVYISSEHVSRVPLSGDPLRELAVRALTPRYLYVYIYMYKYVYIYRVKLKNICIHPSRVNVFR